MTNNNNLGNTSIYTGVTEEGLSLAYQYLDHFFDNQAVANQLFTVFSQGYFSGISEVKILSDDVLGATNGGYTLENNQISFNEQIEVAFGTNYNQEVANELFTAFAEGDFSAIPEIKILSDEVLGATNGGYSAQTNEIYLNERFLAENVDNVEAVATVLIEEIGHFIDAQINTEDSAGDEGAIFSALVQGESLSAKQLQQLRLEDDSTTITLNGNVIDIEQNTYKGGSGNDSLRGVSSDDDLYGYGGDDTLHGYGGDDTLHGGSDNDSLKGGSGNDSLLGDDGNDTLNGHSGNDTLDGGSGNDTFHVNDFSGNDEFHGGDGIDTIIFNPSDGRDLHIQIPNNGVSDGKVGSQRFYDIEVFRSGSGNDILDGGSGNDSLDGGSGNDYLRGGDGNDTLDGHGGRDTLDGGDGIDTADFSYTAGGTLFDIPNNDVNGETILNIENIIGTQGDDTIIGDDGANDLNGHDGNDILNGGSGNDYLRGGDGNDTLDGHGGRDTLDGGDGIDTADFSYTTGGTLFDIPNNHVNGEPIFNIENIIGTQGNDTIIGDDGANDLNGQDGNDYLRGGDGNDTLDGHGGRDTLDGGDGIDTADFSYNTTAGTLFDIPNNHVNGEPIFNIENIIGTQGDDTIIGDGKANRLEGDGGHDLIEGGNGNDTLVGSLGNDTLDGQSGNDRVIESGDVDFILSNTPTIPDGYTEYNGHFYLLSEAGTWEEAQTQAQSLGGNLVTINDANEQQWLIDTFGNDEFWIGLTDKETEGTFQWINGESVNYINWAPNEPNDDNTLGEDYASMNYQGFNQWNDFNGQQSFQGIIEITDINNLPNPTVQHQLTGLGTDTLKNIETVELQGGASNNIFDASLTAIDVNFQGLEGDDTLKAGLGDDTLSGGAGTNELWGGEGNDTFVTQSDGVQIIKDFERGVDLIDMQGTQVNQISFDFESVQESTIINVNGTERVRVEGSLVDSSSLINTSNDINPQPLTSEQVKNLSEMLQNWAEDYAESLGLSTNNVRLVNDQLSMVGGDLTFVDYGTEQTETNQGLQIENMTRNASMFFRNNSSEDSSVTFTYSDGKGYEVSTEDTSEWTKGNTVGLSVANKWEAGLPFIGGSEVTVTASYEHNWSQGGSNTTIDTDNVNTQQDTSIDFTAPAGAVTVATATATGGEYSGGTYEIPFTISGTIGIDLNGDGDALDANEINNLPVNAILQYYNPQQFVGEGFQRTFELPTGQVLAYNESSQAKVTGTADGAYFTSVNASVASAYDWSLTNPTTSEYLNGVNYQAQLNTGNAVGQAIEERYWLIRNGEYGPRPSGTTLRIEGFTPSEDFIGIDHNAIKSNDDILLGTDLATGVDPADKLILRAGSYTQNDITFQTTQIIMGGTGSDFTTIEDNDILAELINVAPEQLLGSSDGSPRTSLTRGDLDTNFIFGTQGTIWDHDLATGDGTNLLQLLETV